MFLVYPTRPPFGTYAVLSLALSICSYIHIQEVLLASVAAGLRNASAEHRVKG